MSRFPELTGKRFGKLVVESKAETDKKCSMWNCRCDCGNTCVVRGASLIHGKRTDCGCITVRFYDLAGKRFGMLVAEKKMPPSSDGKTRWMCRCDCGKQFVATSLDLRNGKKTDCGCVTDYHSGNHSLIDLAGQRFGKLTVLSKENAQKDGHTRWQCRCDCGNVCTVTSFALRKGKIKSCGCGRRKDITGQRFGKLTAIKRTERFTFQSGRKKFLWECRCDCGETVYMLPEKLRKNINHACARCASKMCVDAMRASAGFVEGTQVSKIVNTTPNANSKSGIKGVFWNKATRKWRAVLRFQRIDHYLGEYTELENAVKARKKAEEEYFAPVLERYFESKEKN